MKDEQKPLVPFFFHLSRGEMIVSLLIAGIVGFVVRGYFEKHVPGFAYQEGLLFEVCYQGKTRVEIARCLDRAYESADELSAWDLRE